MEQEKKKNQNWTEQRKKLIKKTKEAISKSIDEDQLIIATITTIEVMEENTNGIIKKTREWQSLYLPELEHKIKDHEKFLKEAEKITNDEERRKKLKELGYEESMGGILQPTDIDALIRITKESKKLLEEIKALKEYLEELMERRAPGLQIIAGTTIGAKLIRHAGSLKKLSMVPASTIQLYGAENALFRHLKNKKNRPPKYGVIFNHPLIQKTNKKERGKIARALADKISMIAKIEYFNNDKERTKRKAEEYLEELRNKFNITE